MIAKIADVKRYIWDEFRGPMALFCNKRRDHAKVKEVAPVRKRPCQLGTKLLSFLHCSEPSLVGPGNAWRLYVFGFGCSLSS